MEDKEIVLGLINGEQFALDDLSRTYGKLIYGVINKILYNFSEINDVDECFNDVLITIWRNIDCYDSTKGSLRNFLISVAKYKAIDYKRKINKRGISLELNEEIVYTEFNESIEVDNEEFYMLLKTLKEEDKNIFIKNNYSINKEEYKEFLQYLLNGYKNKARDLILNIYNNGMDIEWIYFNILETALKEVGVLWEIGEIDVWNEHYISESILDIMREVKSYEKINDKLME